MWKTSDGDEKCDVALTKFKHRSVVDTATQKTITDDGPRLSTTVVFVVPDGNSLNHEHTQI